MDTRHYEMLYIIPITFAGEALQPLVDEITAKVKELGGEITREQHLGKMKFAYAIKHNHQGFYLLLEFDMKPSDTVALEKWLKLKREVLRYIIVKKDPEVKDVLDMEPEKGLVSYFADTRPESTEEASEKSKEEKKEKVTEKKEKVKAEKETKNKEEKKEDVEEKKEELDKDIDKKLDQLLEDQDVV